MVSDNDRALVRGAIAAHRAWNDHVRQRQLESDARARWFYASQTRDEAIERGTKCYLAAMRADDTRRPELLYAVHIETLRTMVADGELSPEDAHAITSDSPWDRDRLLGRDAWFSALTDAEFAKRVERGEIWGALALSRGVLPSVLEDESLTSALLDAWSPLRDDAGQRAVLAGVDRARLIDVMRGRLIENNQGFGEDTIEAWMTARYNDGSIAELAIALLAGNSQRVVEMCQRLRDRRAVSELDQGRYLRWFDEREAICAQLARFGEHALALSFVDDLLREPPILETLLGPSTQSLSAPLLRTLREHLTPEVMSERLERAIERYESRRATADDWLSLTVIAASDERLSALASRALRAFDEAPSVMDGSLIPTECRAAWAPSIERHIDALIERLERRGYEPEDAYETSAVLSWIDAEDPSMVRALWGPIRRLRVTSARCPTLSWANDFDRWMHRAALFGSDEARAEFDAKRPPRSQRLRHGYDAVFSAQDASDRAQARWVNRVIREAPSAARDLSFVARTAEQQRALDFARIRSGRESLWTLATFTGVVSREAQSLVLDRWYREGCPVEGSEWLLVVPLRLVRERALREAPCSRRTRWMATAEELLAWIEQIDVRADVAWQAEPGLQWLIAALDDDERGRAQLRRLLDERLAALLAEPAGGAEWLSVSVEVRSLLGFASEAQLLACLEDDRIPGLLFSDAGWRELRALGARALGSGLRVARAFAKDARVRLGAIDTARGVAAFAEEHSASIEEAVAMIGTFAEDVRALSDDWLGEVERWLCSDAGAACRRYRQVDDALRTRLRLVIEQSGLAERQVRWLLEDDAFVVANLQMFAPAAEHAPVEYAAVLSRLGGTEVIDAIGDVLVDWLIEENR